MSTDAARLGMEHEANGEIHMDRREHCEICAATARGELMAEADAQHRDLLAEEIATLRTKTGRKQRAQLILMHGIAVAQGYWHEQDPYVYEALGTEEAQDEFARVLAEQADRVARLFGYDEAWGA